MDESPNTSLITHKRRTFAILNKYEYIILIFGTVGLCFSLIVAIYNLVTEPNGKFESERTIFPIIVIICSIFTAIYLYRGVFEERSYELMLYVISAVSLMFYILINFINRINKQGVDDVNLVIKIRLGVLIVIFPITAIISTLLAYNYNVRGRLILHTIAVREELHECCKNVFVFQALLQLDLQFELCMIVLCIAQNMKFGMFQYVVLSFGVPFSVIWQLVGFFSVKYEKRIASYLFFIFGFIEPSYIIYIIYSTIVSIINANGTPIINPVTPIISITFTCCSLSLLIRVLLLLMHIVVHRKFGTGLMEEFNKTKTLNSTVEYGSINPLLLSNNEA